ncbi:MULTISPECIES: folate-binding protein YgfZ [unclassified Leptolyngbya]|uniref:CAF17-like 4Fe-4S cluster assembly/insertion protein YgfZ n=1 Tax=unclassified Leptolyngbya TaxID=2650499 RepID=UPI0016860DB7|nr:MULTISPECIES: folate-binding protein YgfZ [unclassified Leptolyngbya]MBD1910872.1 folate-binding protein YgfZ [Leptolyngbya sp. FACHB-8]MBD2153733.1 folate-binding protein YgfZ [Leptolyngbya sp. FACHB-16]
MSQALRNQQTAQGAQLGTVAEQAVPLSFSNDAIALQATQTGVALYDRTHWGRIRVGDRDYLRFLHNQTTNAFEGRKPGEGCDTVFVTSTARTIDLATAYILEDGVLLLVSPGRSTSLIAWMDRYIFFADKVSLQDVTTETAAFSVIGPESETLLRTLEVESLSNQPYGTHQEVSLKGIPVRVAVGSGVAIAGYTLITPIDHAADLWGILVDTGAVPMGENAWEQLRIQQGRPVPDHELTDDFNPLEAGLWSTISLSKGCYIGQETIARLYTYRGVKQQLWGIQLEGAVTPGSTITAGAEKVGVLTSSIATDAGYWGLAYIRTKALEGNLQQVQVEGVSGYLVSLPFVDHTYL